jgi:hypothetical protein
MGARSRPVPRVVEAAGRGHLQRPAANGGLREDLTIDEAIDTWMHNDPLMCRRLIQRDRPAALYEKWLYRALSMQLRRAAADVRRRDHTRPTPTHEPCALSPAGGTGWPPVPAAAGSSPAMAPPTPERLITPRIHRQHLRTRRARSLVRSRKSQQAAMVIGGTTGWAVVQLRSAVAGPRMLVMARAALLPLPRSQRPACQRRS